MPRTPVYQVIDEAVRRPSPLSRERGLPILVIVGEPAAAARAAGTAAWFGRRVPYAELDAGDFPDVAAIAERLAGAQGMLSTWVRGTLLPPPRFPLTLFALWAWSRRGAEVPGAGTPPNPVVKRLVFRQWMAEWRKERARTGRVRRAMADYVGRAMTTWIPASGLAAYGLQKLVDGVSLVVWGAGIAVALVGGLVHALLLIRGPIFYRWFRRAPYLRRGRDESVVEYAVRVSEAPPEEVERLLVAALLEDLRQAYQRRVIPWPGWGRDTYPVLQLRNAEPGTAGRRFMELVDDVRSVAGQKGPLLVVASTTVAPAAEPVEPPTGPEPDAVELFRGWRERVRRLRPSPYVVIEAEPSAGTGKDEPRRLLPVRPLGYWLAVTALLVLPLTGAVVATSGCGAELTRVAEQCVGLGALEKMAPHPLVQPVLERIERQNARIPFTAKVFTVAYLGPLTTQPGAAFKDGQMAAVAGELTGIGAYQDSYNRGKSDWKMRIVFANTGQDFLSAELAARDVEERARRDPSLTAVVGFAWSREEVRRAVDVLTRANLPMVSTVSTVGRIAGTGRQRSAYLFRLAVVDELQTRATVAWLDTLGLADDVGPRPDVAVVWQRQEGELYSEDLKNLFLRDYPGRRSDHSFGDDASLGAAMEEACGSGARVVYYTGRADFLTSLKRAWGASCERRKVRLLVSDDLTGAVANDVASNGGGHDTTLSFVSLTDVRDASLNQGQKSLRQWAGTSGVFSFAHASFGYDAAQAVAIAVDAYRTQGGAEDIRAGVHYNLRGLRFDGATGTVTFSGDAKDHDAQGREVWLMSVASGQPIRAMWVCRPTAAQAGCTAPPG
ncbi:ABC transporter substrate-binding protein [Nonomuraea rhodomycinica]|uniref:ABC transporter substrate-binding protein n=1 Tax=Nonomuraea rhodomycinica TaxID=1712872 RepID=A0A7Y6IWK1_9ACTN|nr:ABC transporter substrate-binding protein [Nonomuraea rhodomycinica]NUW45732.1 ABC transporter substrate-binding protein [Nonomuraea rhodomycinica]